MITNDYFWAGNCEKSVADMFAKNMVKNYHTPDEDPDRVNYPYIWYVNLNDKAMPQIVAEHEFCGLDMDILCEDFCRTRSEFVENALAMGINTSGRKYSVSVLCCSRTQYPEEHL